jgi:predicted enzyme related to lactoylglutathione lyase
MMNNIINWFEIPSTDIGRAIKFYNSILGIKITDVDMFETKMGFFPTDGKNVSGAIVQSDDYKPSSVGTLIYLNGGNNLETHLAKVEMAGGKIIVPKTQISQEMGYFAIFIDTEGNKVALHSIG